jgi:hypothetical protein
VAAAGENVSEQRRALISWVQGEVLPRLLDYQAGEVAGEVADVLAGLEHLVRLVTELESQAEHGA